MWEVVNSESGRSTRHCDYTELLTRPDGSKFPSKKDTVDAVNAHFVSAAGKCGAPPADIVAAMNALASTRPPADRALRIRPFSAPEVFRILTTGVAHKKSKDMYDISIALLYAAAGPLAHILSCLYNICSKAGKYPLALKQVRVSPLYKGKGKQEEINSYRPVSIIPAVAKIFEHGISTRLTEFLTESESLSDRQYAYRKGRSTTSLAREVIRRILEARESNQQVAVIFCDLSKAFDVADHKVLAGKMKYYGVDGPALKLMVDFMTNRHQVVVGNRGSVKSQPLETVIGVAQGSSLSNIMFTILLNDLPEHIREAHILMYADDVAAIVTAPSTDQLERKLCHVARDLSEWFRVNGLILNTTKTHFIHFSLSGRTYNPLEVKVGNVEIDQIKTTTFLGFILDSGLTWEGHIDNLCDRIGRACFALWRVSAILPHSMVRNCYFASVHSLIQYGIELWGRAADWERVFRMQKRAVRAIARVPQETSALALFRTMKILTVPSLVCFQAALYARDNLDQYSRLGDRYGSGARYRHRLRAVPRRLTKTSKLVHVMAPAVYNRLPDKILDASSRPLFKVKLKNWLVEQAFYKFDDMIN